MVTLMLIFNILLSVAITLESAIQNNLSKSWIFSKEISVVEFRYSEIIVLTLIHSNFNYGSETYDIVKLYWSLDFIFFSN